MLSTGETGVEFLWLPITHPKNDSPKEPWPQCQKWPKGIFCYAFVLSVPREAKSFLNGVSIAHAKTLIIPQVLRLCVTLSSLQEDSCHQLNQVVVSIKVRGS